MLMVSNRVMSPVSDGQPALSPGQLGEVEQVGRAA